MNLLYVMLAFYFKKVEETVKEAVEKWLRFIFLSF